VCVCVCVQYEGTCIEHLLGHSISLCSLCVDALASYFVGLIGSEEAAWACLPKLVRFLALSASDVLASGQRQRRHRPLQPQRSA
jgi:hypothetical protein